MDEEPTTDSKMLEHWSFLLLLAAVSILFVWVAWPFAGPVLWAGLAAIMFQPLYKWCFRITGERPNLAASLSLLIIFVAVLLPALWIGSVVVEEALRLVNTLRANPINIREVFDTGFGMLPQQAREFIESNGWTDVSILQERVQNALGESAGLIAQQAVSIGSGAVAFFLSFGIGLYVLFFLLRDGERIGETILLSAPVEREIADRLANRFVGIVRAVIKGSGVVGLVQGTLGGIMLMIAGVPSPLLLGVLMAILALIPVLGTALVWAPAGIWLLVVGEIWQGVFVLGFGFFIVASVDNVLRPILVGRDTGIPDWIVLITTLGGISLAGFSGIVLGPLVAGLFLAAWSILQEQRAADQKTVKRYRRLKVDPDGKARPDKEPSADLSDASTQEA